MKRWMWVMLALGLVGCKDNKTSQAHNATAAQTAAQTVASQPEKVWSVAEMKELDQNQLKQLERAQEAQKYLGTILVHKVSTTANEKGFPAAIDVCKTEAKTMTASVSAQKGVRIGRTSDKLRNSDNVAPSWMALVTGNRNEKPKVLTGPKGELGWAVPIRANDLCLNCHGTPDKLHRGVAEALAEKYPQDQAVGYNPGDLRGWFWVEVPAT